MRIVYIDIDSCRPDHLSCYGYHRNTSPHIDAIARESVLFRNCYTPDAPCLPSRTAFYSGRFGIQTGVVGHGGTAAQPRLQGKLRGFRDHFDEQGLARQFQKLGLHTAMISPFGQRHAAHWFYAGFNEIHNTGEGGMESAETVWPVLDRWLSANVDKTSGAGRDDYFLHVNFWDPHTPYRVPASYGNPFEHDPLPKHLDDDRLIARHRALVGPHTARDLGMYTPGDPARWPREVAEISDRASMKKWIDGYDTGIRYVDDQVGKLVARLKAADVYDDTAIVISADHGENQGDWGIYAEHGTADQATCRIPMIIKWPGVRGGRASDRLVYNLDFAPTAMDLLGGKPCDLWDGQSYADTLKTPQAAAGGTAAVRSAGEVGQAGRVGQVGEVGEVGGREQLVLSQCAHVCQRSVRWGKWLYIRTYHDGFRLTGPETLFDLAADPFEQDDVSVAYPEACREGAWRLSNWHADQMTKLARVSPHDVTDPLWTVIAEGGPFHALHERGRSPLPKYLQRLEATDRAEGAAALREKYREHL